MVSMQTELADVPLATPLAIPLPGSSSSKAVDDFKQQYNNFKQKADSFLGGGSSDSSSGGSGDYSKYYSGGGGPGVEFLQGAGCASVVAFAVAAYNAKRREDEE